MNASVPVEDLPKVSLSSAPARVDTIPCVPPHVLLAPGSHLPLDTLLANCFRSVELQNLLQFFLLPEVTKSLSDHPYSLCSVLLVTGENFMAQHWHICVEALWSGSITLQWLSYLDARNSRIYIISRIYQLECIGTRWYLFAVAQEY